MANIPHFSEIECIHDGSSDDSNEDDMSDDDDGDDNGNGKDNIDNEMDDGKPTRPTKVIKILSSTVANA